MIDDRGSFSKLRYVFDIQDTHMVRGGKTPYLWKLEEGHYKEMLAHLEDAYGLVGDDAANLQSALLAIAAEMAEDNLEEAMDGLEYVTEDSFLHDLNPDALRVNFRNLLRDSAFYTLSRRCGLNPMEYLEVTDFMNITDFNPCLCCFFGKCHKRTCRTSASGYWSDCPKNFAGRIGKYSCKYKQDAL